MVMAFVYVFVYCLCGVVTINHIHLGGRTMITFLQLS